MDKGDSNGARTEGTQGMGQIPPPPGTDGPRSGPQMAGPQQAYGPPQGWWYYQPPVYQPAQKARRSSKPKIAGILLMFSGAISILIGVVAGSMLVGQWPLEIMESMEGENGELQGEVIFMNNTQAPGVNVTVTDLGLMGITNDTGHYRILNVKKGWHDLKVELEGYQVLIRSVYVNPTPKYSAEVNVTKADFQLQPGTGELRIGETHTPGTTRSASEDWAFLGEMGAVCLTVGLVMGSLSIIGGYYALQYKRLGVAVIGSFCAVFSFGTVFGIIAIILLVLSTDEFERQKREDGLAA